MKELDTCDKLNGSLIDILSQPWFEASKVHAT